MQFNNGFLSEDINLLSINNFNVYQNDDITELKSIYKCLFNKGDTLFFSFRREDDLSDEKERHKLRAKILDTFNNEGEYIILRKMDNIRFDSVGRLAINENTYDFLFDIWKYFYSCTFFVPINGFTFENYIAFQKKNKFQDKGNEKLLNNHYTSFSCIKGLGGDYLIISYQKNYKLPDGFII